MYCTVCISIGASGLSDEPVVDDTVVVLRVVVVVVGVGGDVRWDHDVPGHPGTSPEGGEGPGPGLDDHQDHRPARTQILCVDWWFHLEFFVHVRGDVDQKGGVRREWT